MFDVNIVEALDLHLLDLSVHYKSHADASQELERKEQS